jgi:uncharacterized protein GlcG (DUF336 family)
VLAVYQMAGAPPVTEVTSNRGVTRGLEGVDVGTTVAAISKAGTAAYLSSQGNAFTTRTAGQIVQQNFNPGENGRAGGPLFGVQFSQLPCGDFVRRFDADALTGPKRLPLGFSADPGGLPLYQNGVPVGGVGVEGVPAQASYTLDADIFNVDTSLEERIASAGARGFSAPSDRRANRIAVDGRFLRFADDESAGSTAPATLDPMRFVGVAGFYDPGAAGGPVFDGALFLDPASGVVASTVDGQPAELLVDSMGMSRFPPSNSAAPAPAGGGLTAAEVRTILTRALDVAARARAQIRRPTGSAARVNISVVDLGGNLLGFARSPDAPVFGMDVSLQKARTAAFFSDPGAAAALTAAAAPAFPSAQAPATYLADLRAFLGDSTALANGVAYSDRVVGNLSRPFFPDGINGNLNGPLSRPFADWSPFSTGFQLDLVVDALAAVLGGANPSMCTDPSLGTIRNGIQIFPGSFPIFRGSQLIGAIGISGDGIDQDDLVAIRGLHEAGLALGGAINNAPPAIRADQSAVKGVHLRYVGCPPAPFLDSDEQNGCEGL